MRHKKSARQVPVTLASAMDRVKGLTQLQLEEKSGVDRTRISKLRKKNDTRVLHDTYEKLDGALRTLGALKASERLVFGQPESITA